MTALRGPEVAPDANRLLKNFAGEIWSGRLSEFFNKIGEELPFGAWLPFDRFQAQTRHAAWNVRFYRLP